MMLLPEMSNYLTLAGTASRFAWSERYFCIAISPAASAEFNLQPRTMETSRPETKK